MSSGMPWAAAWPGGGASGLPGQPPAYGKPGAGVPFLPISSASLTAPSSAAPGSTPLTPACSTKGRGMVSDDVIRRTSAVVAAVADDLEKSAQAAADPLPWTWRQQAAGVAVQESASARMSQAVPLAPSASTPNLGLGRNLLQQQVPVACSPVQPTRMLSVPAGPQESPKCAPRVLLGTEPAETAASAPAVEAGTATQEMTRVHFLPRKEMCSIVEQPMPRPTFENFLKTSDVLDWLQDNDREGPPLEGVAPPPRQSQGRGAIPGCTAIRRGVSRGRVKEGLGLLRQPQGMGNKFSGREPEHPDLQRVSRRCSAPPHMHFTPDLPESEALVAPQASEDVTLLGQGGIKEEVVLVQTPPAPPPPIRGGMLGFVAAAPLRVAPGSEAEAESAEHGPSPRAAGGPCALVEGLATPSSGLRSQPLMQCMTPAFAVAEPASGLAASATAMPGMPSPMSTRKSLTPPMRAVERMFSTPVLPASGAAAAWTATAPGVCAQMTATPKLVTRMTSTPAGSARGQQSEQNQQPHLLLTQGVMSDATPLAMPLTPRGSCAVMPSPSAPCLGLAAMPTTPMPPQPRTPPAPTPCTVLLQAPPTTQALSCVAHAPAQPTTQALPSTPAPTTQALSYATPPTIQPPSPSHANDRSTASVQAQVGGYGSGHYPRGSTANLQALRGGYGSGQYPPGGATARTTPPNQLFYSSRQTLLGGSAATPSASTRSPQGQPPASFFYVGAGGTTSPVSPSMGTRCMRVQQGVPTSGSGMLPQRTARALSPQRLVGQVDERTARALSPQRLAREAPAAKGQRVQRQPSALVVAPQPPLMAPRNSLSPVRMVSPTGDLAKGAAFLAPRCREPCLASMPQSARPVPSPQQLSCAGGPVRRGAATARNA